MAQNDGEWWLRGTPAPRGRDAPRSERPISIAYTVLALEVFHALSGRRGWVVGLVALLPLACALWSLPSLRALLRGRTDEPLAHQALAPLSLVAMGLYLLGAFGYPRGDSTGRAFEIAGVALAVLFVTLLRIRAGRASERPH